MTVQVRIGLTAGALIFGFGAALAVFGQTFGETYQIPGWGLAGTNRYAYFIGLDRETKHGGEASITVRCDSGHCDKFGDIVQTIRAGAYLGQRLCLSAWVKGRKAGHVGLWMRVDASDSSQIQLDNMRLRGKSGTFDWRRMYIVLDVPPPGALIHFGLILEGAGQAWLDDVTLEPVAADTKSTNLYRRPTGPIDGAENARRTYARSPEHPVNLDFEQPVVPVKARR